MQAIVKKWVREKDYGFIENGSGPDIMVRKSDLINCKFLKNGATVEFECHLDKRGLIAKKVKLLHQRNERKQQSGNRVNNHHPFGVMT